MLMMSINIQSHWDNIKLLSGSSESFLVLQYHFTINDYRFPLICYILESLTHDHISTIIS